MQNRKKILLFIHIRERKRHSIFLFKLCSSAESVMGGKYLTLSATGVVLGLTGSICVCVAFFTNHWLTVLKLVVEESNETDGTDNYRESKESPNPGEYGLWFKGQSLDVSTNLKKSFLNCDAIPFSGQKCSNF